MGRQCEVCGKTRLLGNKVARRGLPKKKGGIGLKTTGITRREFRPNLQRIKAIINGKVRHIRACARCIQSGRVQKAL